ncbi:universal stress protein [Reinekea marinisedimentorum]|uniref:Nucleotide-binding universal stress UspA family protein n=1 Tax=Reinekea marinisedimentorum TaxID=230495 RepID=A0A4R3HVI7_9GAMM|nr:universal stress protein [Reinekea marinisedimentorum]TCS37132.1 nucleotide-binding universal stress UspA family protein [Reinekea marinisedimentorum]
MHDPNVIVPIFSSQPLDQQYDQAFAFLNARNATLHLVAVNNTPAVIHADSAELRDQQAQILKMAQYLKFETLDRMAVQVQQRFPCLRFEYHAGRELMVQQVQQLTHKLSADLLLLPAHLAASDCAERDQAASLISQASVPVWAVSAAQPDSGMILGALDIPVNNRHADRFNRILVITASQLAAGQGVELLLLHGWMNGNEQFLKKWLRLNEMDIARISRADKQQRLSYLKDYAQAAELAGAAVRCQVSAAGSAEALAELCNQLSPQLVVAGISQHGSGTLGANAQQLLSKANADVLLIPEATQPGNLFAAQRAADVKLRNKET